MNYPKQIAGIRIPDSEIAQKAMNIASKFSDKPLFSHVMRTYVFGAIAANARRWKFDEEASFIASILHDLGITDEYERNDRFELVGADAAKSFLKNENYPPEKIELIWDAIALHTSAGIAMRKEREVAIVHIGAAMDVFGLGVGDLPKFIFDEIIEHLPRNDFKNYIVKKLISNIEKFPATTNATWLSDVGRQHVHNYNCPCVTDAIKNSVFGE